VSRNKSVRKDTGYSTGSSHDDNRRNKESKRKDKRKSHKDDDGSPEKPSKKRRKSRESSKEDEEKYEQGNNDIMFLIHFLKFKIKAPLEEGSDRGGVGGSKREISTEEDQEEAFSVKFGLEFIGLKAVLCKLTNCLYCTL